jgi:catechol 2,3-dioxygenase-like lactoylglutathione lyase family enzyme
MQDSKKLVRSMGHAALLVDDIKVASKFYREVLELNSVWEGDEDWSNFELGGDDLSLVKKQDAVHPPHIGFYVASLEGLKAMHARVKATGVKTDTIDLHRDGTSSFYFRDLDNNLLEMIFDPRKNMT